jgi:hypothetical protein
VIARLPLRRKQKYGAVPTIVDGMRFASTGEAKRWGELKLLEKAGAISGLQRQVKFPLNAQGGGLLGHAILDFVYVEDGKRVLEDFKGVTTALAHWKLNHVSHQYGIDVRIVRAAR